MTTTVPSQRARAGLLAAVAVLACPIVSAQAPTLPETRVTATRFAEPAESLPFGVSVLTADEIRAAGATSVNDAVVRLLGVPGRQDLYGGGEYNLDLRGFGATADQNQVIVLDGVRLTEADLGGTRLSGIPIESVERIEVVRGSGAVLYGEGATGGVIVITTKAGAGLQQPNGATLYGALGSHRLRDLRASGSVRTATGFSLDAHAQKRKSDGYRVNQDSDADAASVTGQWSNDWLRFGARFSQDRLRAGLPGSLTLDQFRADPRQSTSPTDRALIHNERATVFGSAELGAWQLQAEASRRDKELRSTFGAFAYDYDVEATSYGLRARNETTIAGLKNTLVLGADIADWRRDVLGPFGATATQQSRGYYAKDDLTLRSGTRVSLGLRTERFEKDAGTVLDDRQNAWELGVSHPFTSGLTGYARVGRSFRLANVDEFNFTTPGVDLRPQVSRDLEGGLRWKHAAGKVEARVYRSKLTDEIGFDPNAVGPGSAFGFNGANVNLDPTRRQGLELDAKHAVGAGLELGAHLAWRDAKFRSGAYAGNQVALAPRRTAALRADWTPAAGHRVSAGVNWVSSQYADFANTCRIPSYVTADARYAWQVRPDVELALGATNLFDRDHYTQGACSFGQLFVYPEAGRRLTASVRVQF
jgi:iron complex outermembrane receptor protein